MFLALLFALAISVWLVPLIERARLPLLGMMVLIIGTVFGPAFFAVDGPLLMSLDRVLFAVLCIIAFFSLPGETATIPRWNSTDWIVVAYVVWVLISTQHGEAPSDSSPVGTWIFYVLLPAAMYLIVRVARIRDVDLRRVETAMIWLGCYLSFTAICEWRGWYSLVFPKYIADPATWEFFGRGRGPLLNPSGNGIVLTSTLAVAAVRFLRGDRRQRLIYSVICVLMLAGLYATLTRSVWIGAALALVIVFWQVMPRWSKVLGFFACGLLVVLIVAGLKEQLLRMKRDKALSAQEAEKSVQLRPLLAIIAYEMVKDSPVIGHGFGHYFQASPPYFSDRRYAMPLEVARGYHQHNVLLSIAVNTGLIGCVMFVWLLYRWTTAGWYLSQNSKFAAERSQAGLIVVASIAGYLVGGMFQDVTIIPMINLYLFYWAGTIENLWQAAAEPSEQPTRSHADHRSETIGEFGPAQAVPPIACPGN